MLRSALVLAAGAAVGHGLSAKPRAGSIATQPMRRTAMGGSLTGFAPVPGAAPAVHRVAEITPVGVVCGATRRRGRVIMGWHRGCRPSARRWGPRSALRSARSVAAA